MHILVTTGADELPRINLGELHQVREHHMPAYAVRFASEGELERVAEEVSRQHPPLREEAHFVKEEELRRRERLAQYALRVTA
ncbi:MAG: hypothetical protein ACRYFX_07335 [Janthinobacterium lividum]